MQKQLIRESLFQIFREFFHSRKFLLLKYPKFSDNIFEIFSEFVIIFLNYYMLGNLSGAGLKN